MLSGGVGMLLPSTTGSFALPFLFSRTRVTRVGLRPVPVRAVERRDRPGVVEERVRVPRLRLEAELVADVGMPVPVLVDPDLVENAVVEAVEVRPAGRRFERDVVRDDRDRVRVVWADERVQVGVVRPRVLADQRRLRMARGFGVAPGPGKRVRIIGERQRPKCERGGHDDRLCGSVVAAACMGSVPPSPRWLSSLVRSRAANGSARGGCACRCGPRARRPGRRGR